MSVLEDLNRQFGDYLAEEKKEDWERVKTTLLIHQTVSGEVRARYPFGVFIDGGVGFPMLIRVPELEQARERPFHFPENYPPVGTVVSARVVGFDDRQRQVVLTQRSNHPIPARPPDSD